MSEWKKLKNVDMHCFACGLENPHGLQMKFESNGTELRSDINIPQHLRGWSSLAHGGVLATILDETMSWTAIHLFQRFILTQNMSVEYRKPVHIKTDLKSFGRIKEQLSDRKAVLEAEIRDGKNEVCVRSTGKFVLFSAEEFKKMDLVPNDLLEEMEGMFE